MNCFELFKIHLPTKFLKFESFMDKNSKTAKKHSLENILDLLQTPKINENI
jgi:hypothetical protein